MSQNNHQGQAQAQAMHGGAGEMDFIVRNLISQIQTVTLVQVVAVKSSGLAPVGMVDVRPMVAQLDGAGRAVAHGVIHNVPYFRLQGGKNAVILDPQEGDIGMCGFCSRDISSVKSNKTPSAPQSRRRFDYADGLYFGGFLNGIPQQYIMFGQGIKIYSPQQVEIEAPNLILKGATEINGTLSQTGGGAAEFSGSLKIQGNLESDSDVLASGKSFLNHTNGGIGLD